MHLPPAILPAGAVPAQASDAAGPWLQTIPGVLVMGMVASILGGILLWVLGPVVERLFGRLKEKLQADQLRALGFLALVAALVTLVALAQHVPFELGWSGAAAALSGVFVTVTLFFVLGVLLAYWLGTDGSRARMDKLRALLTPGFAAAFLALSTVSYGLAWSTVRADLTDTRAEMDARLKTTIALLLPIKDVGIFPKDYGSRQIGGLVWLWENRPEVRKDFEFVLIDHSGKYSDGFAQDVQEEMRRGTKYFLATESRVCIGLSRDFKGLYEEVRDEAFDPDQEPVLVCTSSSSPVIETDRDHVYRFYIRSIEEADVLARAVPRDLGKRLSAHVVAIDDTFTPSGSEGRLPGYGSGAADEFRKCWDLREGEGFIDVTFLPRDVVECDEYVRRILGSPNGCPDVIFVASYGNQLAGIIQALHRADRDELLDPDTKLLFTAPLNIEGTASQVAQELKDLEGRWWTCAPELHEQYLRSAFGNDLPNFNLDVEVSFVFFALDKMTYVIWKMDDERGFDELWNTRIPTYLNGKPDTTRAGDWIVDLEFTQEIAAVAR